MLQQNLNEMQGDDKDFIESIGASTIEIIKEADTTTNDGDISLIEENVGISAKKNMTDIRSRYLSKLTYHQVWLSPLQQPKTS